MSFRRASPAPQRLLRTRGVTQARIKLWLARHARAMLCDIGGRADGEKELTEALKEMGIKKMGHRQAIVGAVMGK